MQKRLMKKIKKSKGVTPTEKLLSNICERTFLKLWSYPNPFNENGDELCDLIAVFDDHVFIFFDRESRKFDNSKKGLSVTWERWKREVIDKQIKTLKGAEKYIRTGKPIFLDNKCKIPLPVNVPESGMIHKFVVAHGAEEARKKFSNDDFYGSLAICYGKPKQSSEYPFFVKLEKNDPVHILDSSNIEIILGELDTIHDLTSFINEKENAIKKYDSLLYFAEEDLLAHYFFNYDENLGRHRIGVENLDSSILLEPGFWKDFVNSEAYERRKKANKNSYFWDKLMQRTYQQALDGSLFGNFDLASGNNPINEMAREPRFARRILSEQLLNAIRDFPETDCVAERSIKFMVSSHDPDKGYVFLQMKCPQARYSDDNNRLIRQKMLRIACGIARNRYETLKTVVGIGIYPPKFTNRNSEDFILLDCSEWTEEDYASYELENKTFGFFTNMQMSEKHVKDFP